MVDDIWLSGHFARHHIKRFVVPIWDLNVDVTRTSAVEMNLVRHKKSRYEANTIMLKYFRQEFTGMNFIPLSVFILNDRRRDCVRNSRKERTNMGEFNLSLCGGSTQR